jgi:hypothetical protein
MLQSQFFRGVASHLAHFTVDPDESPSERIYRQLFFRVLRSGGFDSADHFECPGRETGKAGQQPRVLGITQD